MAKRGSGMADLLDIPLPFGGMATESSYARPLSLGDRGQIPTTRSAENVVPFHPSTGLQQISQRSGLLKYHADAHTSATAMQDLIAVFSSAAPPNDGTFAFRGYTLLGVADGDVKKLTSSGGWAAPANGTSVNALNVNDNSPVIFSAVHQGIVYWCDGTNYVKYTASSDTMASWTASAGSMPANSSYKARLIAGWAGRIMLSGIHGDESNWFLSKLGDPTDFLYSDDFSEDDAIYGGTADATGKARWMINCLCPYSEDIMLIGCDQGIMMMDGVPTAGGRLIILTETTGMSWGRPFCSDENGVFYFFGSRGGVFMLPDLNSPPQRITQGRIDNQFSDIDLTTHLVRMAWDADAQALRLFITDTAGGGSTNWYWDRRTNSWWKLTHGNADHDPMCLCTIDGDLPADRKLLLGCLDGKVRYYDADTEDDDGTAIDSHIYIGPIKARGDAVFRLDELQCTLANESDPVVYEVLAGRTPQDAYNATAAFSGVWGYGRNLAERRRASGRHIWVKLSNNALTSTWALESLFARIHMFGPYEQRRMG